MSAIVVRFDGERLYNLFLAQARLRGGSLCPSCYHSLWAEETLAERRVGSRRDFPNEGLQLSKSTSMPYQAPAGPGAGVNIKCNSHNKKPRTAVQTRTVWPWDSMPILNTHRFPSCVRPHMCYKVVKILTLQSQGALCMYLINFYVDYDAEKEEEKKMDTISRSSSHLGASSPHCSDLMTIRPLGSTPIISDGNSPPSLFLRSSFQFYCVNHFLVGQVSSTRKLRKQSHTKMLTLILIRLLW